MWPVPLTSVGRLRKNGLLNGFRTAAYVLLLATQCANGAERSRWFVKAGYMPATASPALAKPMRASGLNAVWPKFSGYRPDGSDGYALPRIEKWADACAASQLTLWPVINFCGGKNELDFFTEFRREVTLAGVVQAHTPCPADEEYWRRVIFTRCLKLAELSKRHASLTGIVLDLEMYGADHAGYSAPCACEACIRGAGSRQAAALHDWQRREVTRICRALEQEVHLIAPAFQFAIMHLDDGQPFHEGIALGLGTATVPVMCASERTYAAGYTSDVDDSRERWKRSNAHVRFLGGLSLTEFSTEQLAPQLYALGTHGDGYWLYTLGSLAGRHSDVPAGYQLSEPRPRYWAAFRTASDELQRFHESNGNYVSPLVNLWKSPTLKATLTKRILEPVFSKPPRFPLAGPETQLRRQNTAFVNAAQGDSLRLRVRGLKLRNNQPEGRLQVLAPDGRELQSHVIDLARSQDIEVPVTTSGTHWVLTHMGQNACELTVLNPHTVFLASRHSRLKVHQFSRPLFFLVEKDQKPEVDVLVEDAADSVRVTLRNPTGEVAADKLLAGSQSLSADGPAGVWSLTLSPAGERPFGGIQLNLAPPLAPYLADAPERLLRDKQ